MLSKTLAKFGYPKSLVKEYKNWLLLCRPKQVTLGSLVLICKDDVNFFSKISDSSFKEFPEIIKEVEEKLKTLFGYEKINYLMLMMEDPEVHFHIIPRYSTDKEFADFVFKDRSWPKKPNTDLINKIDENVFNKLVDKLKTTFT